MRVPTAAAGYPANDLVHGDWPDGDPSTGAGPYDLMTGAGVLGARVWVERELHRIVGAWATSVDRPELAVAFDRVAVHHAERADVLFARLPELRELPSAPLVAPAGPGARRTIDALVLPGRDAERAERWIAVADRIAVGYSVDLERTSPLADVSWRRRIPLLIAGVHADIADVVEQVGVVGRAAGVDPGDGRGPFAGPPAFLD